MIGHTVKVVTNRKNTRIVLESHLRQDLQRPQRIFRHRKGWCAVPDDLAASGRFDCIFSSPSIFSEFVGCELVNQPMPIAVAPYFMAPRVDFSDKIGKSIRDPA